MSNQEFKTPQDALAHHGVKGMRWGVRRDPNVNTTHPNHALAKEVEQRKYSRKEILNARVRYSQVAQRSLNEKKELTREETIDAYIANRKTIGEKALTAYFLTPAALYFTSDARATTRMANSSYEKSIRRGQRAALALGLF